MTAGLRLYLAGQLASVTFSFAQVVAVSVIAVGLGPSALGWVVAAQFLPSLLLGPYCGALADRYDRRMLLMRVEAGLGVVAIAYTFGAVSDRLGLPLLLTLASSWGLLNALDTPVRRSLVPSLMPGASLRTSALSNLVVLAGMTVGSAAGGVVFAWAGPEWVFAANAASFAVDVLVLHRLRHHISPADVVTRARGQVREGLQYLLARPQLRRPMAAFAIIGTFAVTFQVSVPLLVTGAFDRGAGAVGAAFAALSFGALAGAAWTVSRSEARDLLPPAAAALGLAFAGAVVAPDFALALAAVGAIGAAWSVYLTATVALFQEVNPLFMGRVMAVFALLMIGSTPIGGPIANALAIALDPRAPFVLGAVASGIGLLLLRRTDDRGWGGSAVDDGLPPLAVRPAEPARPGPPRPPRSGRSPSRCRRPAGRGTPPRATH